MNKSLLTLLDSDHVFYITSHLSPDGDAIGSMLALGTLLTKMGKDVRYMLKDEIPARFSFMCEAVPFEDHFDLAQMPQTAVLMALDCSNWSRTGWESLDNTSIPIVNIDHHPDNNAFGEINWVDAQAAATGELIFSLAEHYNLLNDITCATALFVALVTDTGGFRFSNTTPRTHQMAATLLSQGIAGDVIIDQVLTSQSINSFRLIKDVLQTTEIAEGIASMTLTQAALRQHQLTLGNTPELINYIRGIEGVKIAMLCTEQPDRSTKVSLRSRRFDVGQLARHFDGGGHKLAAGCRLPYDVETSRRKVIAQAQILLQEYL